MTLPDWLKGNELYKQLGEIGRRKSLEPARLIAYKAILDSPEVQRRVSDSATPLDRGEAARQAILDAVSDIKDNKTERSIAEAALCTDKRFVGKSVNDRKAMLETTDGISRDVYKDKRPSAVGQVVAYLSASKPKSESPYTLMRLAKADYFYYNLRCVMRDARNLYCAGWHHFSQLSSPMCCTIRLSRAANYPISRPAQSPCSMSLLCSSLVVITVLLNAPER